MASEDATAEAPEVTFKVKTSADGNHTITMSESATVLDLKTKLAGDDFEKVSTDRMRLIYSGRVMKDPDTLATYKIKSGNTIHMVKSAASNAAQRSANAPSTGSTSAAAGVPTNMAAGTANDPLAGLTGARYAGHVNLPSAGMFGADGGMGAPPNEDEFLRMLEDPNFQQTLNEAFNNPQVIEMMMRSVPGMQDNPQARQMLNSPEFRRMMTNPDALRQAMQLRRAMGGGAAGLGGFPAPGITDTTPAGAAGTTPGQNAAANPFGMNPFMMPPGFGGAGAGGAANPFASLFGPAPGQTPAQSPPAPGSAGGQGSPAANPNAANPFASLFGGGAGGAFQPPNLTPEQLQESLRLMQQGGFGNLFGGGANPFGGAFGAASPPPPADTRPPEEIYAEQLRQLNDMGFFDFDQNVAALRRSGGSVQGAIEQLLR